MKAKDPNEIVAVKCEGAFTEWYSPFYREPFDDDDGFREYYEAYVMDEKPVLGAALGECEDDFITDDLQCHCDRMAATCDDWQAATEDYAATIKMCLADGKTRVWKFDGCEDVKITPYRRGELPPVNEDSLKIYGPYAGLMRERMEAI